MSWRCPACRTQIRHSEVEERPRVGVVYRCSVCRLELKLDEHGEQLRVVPIVEDERHNRRTS